MKSVIAIAAAVSALVLLTLPAEARRYGGFEKGDRFEMKVVKVTSTRQVGFSGTPTSHPVHSSAVKLRKGKVVKFRIKARGRLTAKKISIPLSHSSRTMNEYNLFRAGTVSVTRNAELTMRRRKAIRGTLSFFVRDDSGAEPVFYTTVYKLK